MTLPEKMGTKIIFILTLFIFSGDISFAKESKDPKGKFKNDETFMPQKFKADFEQSFMGSLSGKVKKSYGIIKYLYPRHLWLEVLNPEKERTLFISNTKKSWYYTPPFDDKEQGEVVVQPSSKLILSSFFDTLKNGLKTNQFYTAKKKENHYQIEFVPKTSKEIGVSKAELTFRKDKEINPALEDLQTMVIHYVDQRQVTLSFSKFQQDESIQEEDFIFRPTEKVKVIEQR